MANQVASKVGQVSVPRPISVDNSTYLDMFTTSMSSWWAKPKGPNTEREKILSCTFDHYEIGDKRRKCIILTYPSGYQVWDITSLNNVFEVFSTRSLPCITQARFLPTPAAEMEEGAPFFNAGPVLLLVRDDETSPGSSIVTFAALKTVDQSSMKFKKKKLTKFFVTAMPSVFCIYLLNPITFSRLNIFGTDNRIQCYPESGVAMGPRWLAYATLEGTDEQVNEPITTLEIAQDVGYLVANSLTNSVFAISSYMGSEEPAPPVNPKETDKEKLLAQAAGTLAIYDVVDDRIVLRIKCHREAISHIAFDQSGTLLCVASVSGKSVNVIKLTSSVVQEHGKKKTHVTGTLLYRLIRSVYTAGNITQVSFTSDSKWVAVCTAKGTTHLFPINPDGKPVTTRTHSPLGETAIPSFALDDDVVTTESQQIYALNRIKCPAEGEISSFACEFVPGRSRKILLVNPRGTLVQYQLQPMRTVDSENKAVLKLETVPEQEWDINRKLNMLEVHGDFSSLEALTNCRVSPVSHSENHWASYCEHRTFDTKYLESKKVMITQRVLFHFQTYDEEGEEDLAQSVLMHPKAASKQYRSPVAPFVGTPNRLNASTPKKIEPKSPANVANSLKAAMSTKLDKKPSPVLQPLPPPQFSISPILPKSSPPDRQQVQNSRSRSNGSQRNEPKREKKKEKPEELANQNFGFIEDEEDDDVFEKVTLKRNARKPEQQQPSTNPFKPSQFAVPSEFGDAFE